jgi:hypothetical protein
MRSSPYLMGTATDREMRQEADGHRVNGPGPRSLRSINVERLLTRGTLGAAALASALLILGLDSQLTFIADDWELLVARDGLSVATVFEPFHENIVVGPALIYKLLQSIFGMSSAMPFYVVSISLFLASAVLLFAYPRSRVGDWLALIAAVVILFLGAAFEDLLWAFQLGYFGSAAAGLGMLLALDRGDERGDWFACGLLVVSIAFSSLGLVFLAGAVTDLILGRRPRLRRLFVVLLPSALFAFWWLVWGHDAESHLSGENVTGLLGYVYEAAAAGVVSLLGLATDDGTSPDQAHLIWGKIMVPFVAALVAFRIWREKGVSRGLAIALALALAFWILAGLNRSEERFPTSSRYQYPSAIFLLLLIGESLREVRIPRPALALATVGVALAAINGMSLMEREHDERWRPAAEAIRSSLAAVELAAPSADPSLPVTFAPNPTVPAGRYLDAARDYSSPAYGESELVKRPELEKAGADLTMAQALGLSLTPPRSADIRCQQLAATTSGDTGITLLRGGFTISNQSSGPVEIMLRRFAEGDFSVSLGPLTAGDKTALVIPPDSAKRPWLLGLKGNGAVRLCTT